MTTNSNLDEDFNLYLPDWATGVTTSWCVGAQLRTKDGRCMGNAVIANYHQGERSPWEIVTDAGTTLRLLDAELDELFWAPSWVMDVATSPGIRARTALAQPEPQGPSDEDLLELMPETMRDEFSYAAKVCSDVTGGQVKPGIFRVCLNRTALEYARAVLARWGRPAIEPVPQQQEVG